MPDADATSQVVCSVRDNRQVTAILFDRIPTDSGITALLQMGVPHEALYYNGPDLPSVGHLVGIGDVYVYDGSLYGNRKYSTSTAWGPNIRINRTFAKTANRFTVLLRREPGGVVTVSGFQ